MPTRTSEASIIENIFEEARNAKGDEQGISKYFPILYASEDETQLVNHEAVHSLVTARTGTSNIHESRIMRSLVLEKLYPITELTAAKEVIEVYRGVHQGKTSSFALEFS